MGSNVQPVDGVITYVCDEGFLLVGSMTRTCLPDRSWTDDAPTCEGIVYCTAYESIQGNKHYVLKG